MLKKILAALVICAWTLATLSSAMPNALRAQTPLTTLVPPTPFQTSIPPTPIKPLEQSGLARITADKAKPRLTIGIPYNAEPFASLNENGEVIGFEADIGRAIAEDWGIPVGGGNPPIFRQVTRQDGVDLLQRGEIDLLMGQVIHTRAMEKTLDFSEPYFVNTQVALTLGSNSAQALSSLGGQTVGVVIGSSSQQAVEEWAKTSGASVTIKKLLMFDDGIRALVAGEIAALAGDRWDLDARVAGNGLSGLKLLDGVFRDEPYSVAMRANDWALRMLVNRTLQKLASDGRLDSINEQWFRKSLLPAERRVKPTVWSDLAKDKRSIYDFNVNITAPAQPTLGLLAQSKMLRVAGLGQPDATGKLGVLDSLGQALVNELARRWGVGVQFVTGSPEDLLASGGADLALGIEPHWGNSDIPDRVDFTSIYATHGNRLLVATARNISGFADLLFGNGKNLGIFANDEASFTAAENIGKTAGVVGLRKILIRSDEDIQQYVSDGTMSAVFGDSLRLVPLAAKYSSFMKLLDKEYTSESIAFAVPRGDSEFREMVEQTMQDMAKDGTYERIWKEQFNIGTPVSFIAWPES